MGFVDFLRKVARAATEELQASSENKRGSVTGDSGWFMPKFQGRDICDWVDDVNALKREGEYAEALVIARGCMDSMVEAAQQNPINVMEFYVSQVAIIQHKIKDFEGELSTLDGWLSLGLPAARSDHRIDLEKRSAKARELVAKANGEDPTEHTLEWQRLVALEKEVKASTKQTAPVTGRATANPGFSHKRRSSHGGNRTGWVAPREVLLSPTFVAVDFETANRGSGASACQIALVKVSNGHVIDRLVTLIKPPKGLDAFEFTYLHGISARDVRRAPGWPDIASDVAGFVSDLPVYAHNASFDSGVWSDLDSFFGTRTRPNVFHCSYRTAQRLVPGLENYKLPTVTKELVPWYKLNHHDAGSDAEACAYIIAALQQSA